MEALGELKSGLKQANKRIEDIAYEMYTMGLIYLSAHTWGTFSSQVDRTDTIRKESPSLTAYTTSSA